MTVTDRDMERAINLTCECSCHEGFTSRGLVDPQCAFHLYAEDIASLIAEVRQEAFDGIYRTMEHRARWASKNHPESAYIGACRDTLKALDTLKTKEQDNE